MATDAREVRRIDGVRVAHDPHAHGMAEKYGTPGGTDQEGFDPYADTVGPGIYGGRVKRDADGKIVIGQQYQNHNPLPGPVYAGGGYTEMTRAVRLGVQAIDALLGRDPSLVNEISTGGATPLHMCGMSRTGQLSTANLIAKGADVEAVDTYGFRPLHRMAANNLAAGARALLAAGADPTSRADGLSPLQIALQSSASDVVRVLREAGVQK